MYLYLICGIYSFLNAWTIRSSVYQVNTREFPCVYCKFDASSYLNTSLWKMQEYRHVWLSPFKAFVKLPCRRRSCATNTEVTSDVVFFEVEQDAHVSFGGELNIPSLAFSRSSPLFPHCLPYQRPILICPASDTSAEWMEADLPHVVYSRLCDLDLYGTITRQSRGAIALVYSPGIKTPEACLNECPV